MNNIPAFPRPHSGATQYAQEGMDLRDYFAAKAIQGMLANDWSVADSDVAKWSYVIADAMMKAREKNDA
jgi:hypothetical protein